MAAGDPASLDSLCSGHFHPLLCLVGDCKLCNLCSAAWMDRCLVSRGPLHASVAEAFLKAIAFSALPPASAANWSFSPSPSTLGRRTGPFPPAGRRTGCSRSTVCSPISGRRPCQTGAHVRSNTVRGHPACAREQWSLSPRAGSRQIRVAPPSTRKELWTRMSEEQGGEQANSRDEIVCRKNPINTRFDELLNRLRPGLAASRAFGVRRLPAFVAAAAATAE